MRAGLSPRARALALTATLVVTLGGCGGAGVDDPREDPPEVIGGPARDATRDRLHRAEKSREDKGGARKDSRRLRPEPEPLRVAPREFLVTRVIDGDTLELGNGETVRLVGIDTPEVGECGYEKATDNLAYLVQGKTVTLTISDEDRDRYGRLLRYVNVGPLDAGLRLIQNGVAIARYDSRDGYGFHPREPRYIAADRGSSQFRCPPPPPPAPAPAANCAEGYSPCVPVYPPDVDCPDVNGPVTVTGSDPHGLDADGDGTACE